jgi:murein DD-endopeptidase MepM/ murein hydrolase activator NlpD
VNGKAAGLPSPPARGQPPAASNRGSADEQSAPPDTYPSSISGTYSTASLDAAAQRLRANGVPERQVLERIYPPFIVEGPAAWTNTWHAPRYAGGFHLHEGQDVFCRYGAPVLAAVDGVVQFDTDTLGGNIARLFNPDGSYWYYAHLSGWNTKIQSGSTVHVGDVIGYCGNTGDAVNSPTHVHFGHYLASGQAVNPMRQLIAWLGAAEDRLPKNLPTPRPSPTKLPDDSAELGAAPPALPSGTPSLAPASAPLQPVLRRAPTSTTGDALIVALAIMIPMMLGSVRRRPAGLGAHHVTRR